MLLPPFPFISPFLGISKKFVGVCKHSSFEYFVHSSWICFLIVLNVTPSVPFICPFLGIQLFKEFFNFSNLPFNTYSFTRVSSFFENVMKFIQIRCIYCIYSFPCVELNFPCVTTIFLECNEVCSTSNAFIVPFSLSSFVIYCTLL